MGNGPRQVLLGGREHLSARIVSARRFLDRRLEQHRPATVCKAGFHRQGTGPWRGQSLRPARGAAWFWRLACSRRPGGGAGGRQGRSAAGDRQGVGDDFRLVGIGVSAGAGCSRPRHLPRCVRAAAWSRSIRKPARSAYPDAPGTISASRATENRNGSRSRRCGSTSRSSLGAGLLAAQARSGAVAAEAGRVRSVDQR